MEYFTAEMRRVEEIVIGGLWRARVRSHSDTGHHAGYVPDTYFGETHKLTPKQVINAVRRLRIQGIRIDTRRLLKRNYFRLSRVTFTTNKGASQQRPESPTRRTPQSTRTTHRRKSTTSQGRSQANIARRRR